MGDVCEYCGGELETHDCVGLHADVSDCAEHLKAALAASESREARMREALERIASDLTRRGVPGVHRSGAKHARDIAAAALSDSPAPAPSGEPPKEKP